MGRSGQRSAATLAFVTVLALWTLSPLLVRSHSSQDGPAFIAAAQLARHDPSGLYPFKMNQDNARAGATWTAAYCRADPSGRCLDNHAGFLSPPATAVLFLPLTSFPPDTALLLLRLLSVIPILTAFAWIWRLVGPKGETERRWLFATALLATPVVVNIVTLGQNTGWVLLAAVACTALCQDAVTNEDKKRWSPERWEVALGIGTLVAIAMLLKLFPVVFFLPLLLARRFRTVVTAAVIGVLAVAGSFLWATLDTWSSFLDQARWYDSTASQAAYNRAPGALIEHWTGPLSGKLVVAVILIAMTGIWWWTRRGSSTRLTDSGYWLLLAVAIGAFIWPHYLLLSLPVIVAFVVVERRGYALLPASMIGAVVVQATWHATVAGQVIGLIGVVLLVIVVPVALRLAVRHGYEPSQVVTGK